MSKKDESIFDLIYEERCETGEDLVGVSLEADNKYNEFNVIILKFRSLKNEYKSVN